MIENEMDKEPLDSNNNEGSNKYEKLGIICVVVIFVFIILYFAITNFINRYNVTVDSKNGSRVQTFNIVQNHKISEPQAPFKDGYTFIGWYSNGKPYDFDKEVTSDLSLYAVYEEIGNESNKNVTTTVASDIGEEQTVVVGRRNTSTTQLTGTTKSELGHLAPTGEKCSDGTINGIKNYLADRNGNKINGCVKLNGSDTITRISTDGACLSYSSYVPVHCP